MALPDRKNALLGQQAITGIDFVAVHDDQVTLDVFLFHDPSAMVPAITTAVVTIVGEDEPGVPVVSVVPTGGVDGREVLRVTLARAGGFGRYWLQVSAPRATAPLEQIDPFFRRLELDFKAACPRDVDCAAPAHACPPPDADDVVIDPGARDFWSLRRALLDFASLRHPVWKDRLEADVGVMMVELLAATGDELAYYQDRIGRETQFGSASQRRSIRRHVRLVDYGLHDGLGARGQVAITAAPNPPGWQIAPAGAPVWARGDGTAIGFELGTLDDAAAGRGYRVHRDRNRLAVHVWDGDAPDPHVAHRPLAAACLPIGSTTLHVQGHVAALFEQGEQVFLLASPPPDQRDRPVRALLVTLVRADDETDPLGTILGTGSDVTALTWEEPTPVELDLEWTVVLGNTAPVTAGVTRRTEFSIGPNTAKLPQAIERIGPRRSIAFMHTLPARGPGPASVIPTDALWPFVEDQAVVRLGRDPREAVPEVTVHEIAAPGAAPGRRWDWKASLLGTNSSGPQDRHFVLDDGTWDRAIGFPRPGGEIEHKDYLTGAGATIRFGDGELGRMPVRGKAAAGREVWFRAVYRLGNGVRGNLPPGALRHADPTGTLGYADLATALPFIEAIDNPLPIAGGVEPETIAQARRDAPEEFRARTFRAVRPEDFDEAARRLPWVQQAGTRFRWTGSWSTAFTAADPRGAAAVTASQRREVARHLDRFRMTGRELHVLAPRYADLDVDVTVCVEASAYPAEVVMAIRIALLGRGGLRAIVGFFDPDRFTFGTPIDRSELEAWIQRVPGVRAVKRIELAQRGRFAQRPFTEPYYQPGVGEIVRVSGDPRHPERGTVTIHPEGGA